MISNDFNDGINKLRKEFGQENYSNQKAEIFWNHIKEYPGYLFLEAVTHFIANSKKSNPPMLDRILNYIKDKKEKEDKLEKELGDKIRDYQKKLEEPKPFLITEEWIDKTNEILLKENPKFNAVGAKKIMMELIIVRDKNIYNKEKYI